MTPSALAFAAAFALAAAPVPYRFSRPIQATSGWTRLTLPDDVLDACRPGLPDLRVRDRAGRDIAYAFEQDAPAASRRFAVENLESVDKRETTALVDRGPEPGFADAVTLEIRGDDFLKPVRVQSSDDRSDWKDIGQGSLFVAGGVRMLTLRLPPTDRRYLRFRLDDRNGAPVRPEAAVVRAQSPAAVSPRELPLTASPIASESDSASLSSVMLPAANVDVTALRIGADDPAFSRRVRVYERVFFRDEVCRCLVAEGILTRAPGAEKPTDLPTAGISGRNLEVEIENGDSPPLNALRVTALVRDRTLRFFAPEGESLRLVYGSRLARAPQYDLTRAMQSGAAQPASRADLGPASASDASAPVPMPPRIALNDADKWTSRRPIVLPRSPGLAYLDLDDSQANLSDLRIVDQNQRQVPFVAERGWHEHRQSIRPEVDSSGTVTRIRLGVPAHLSSVEAVELSASAPDYFSRVVTAIQEKRDARGVVANRSLGAVRWERRPGEGSSALRLPVDRPLAGEGALVVQVENGDNAPLSISEVSILTAASRLDFLFASGDRFFLLSGNPEASPPSYDFAMLADVILSSPADAAHVGPAPAAAVAAPRLAAWFWAAVVVAILALVYSLSRTLRTSP